MIGIINYGCGNLFSLENSLKKLGLKCVIVSDGKNLCKCDKIILPGVGAFGAAVEKLRGLNLDKALKTLVGEGAPVLGICLGMQLLFEESYEYGTNVGLGLLKGSVKPLKEDSAELITPHMGWNSLHILKRKGILKYTQEGEYVYFVHSYQAKNCSESLLATAFYGSQVTAAVGCNNVYGVQFHPEKSGESGLKILKAFSEI